MINRRFPLWMAFSLLVWQVPQGWSSLDPTAEQDLCQQIEKTVYLAITPTDCAATLNSIEQMLQPYAPGSPVSQCGTLASAQLLLRLGYKAEATELFEAALQAQWPDAFAQYYKSLLEGKDFPKAAQIEYLRLIRKPPYGWYYSQLTDFSRFNRTVGLFKVHNPTHASMEFIYPCLPYSHRYPQFQTIAKAFCQGYDEAVDDAIATLDSLDYLIHPDWNQQADQFSQVPLYRITILAKAGRAASELQDGFNAFVERNQGKIYPVYDGISAMIESFNINGADTAKITALSALLIKSALFNDPLNQLLLSEDNLAHIYDVHSQGLLFAGRNQEAAHYDRMVYETYYPQTFAGAVCGLRYANHLSGEGNVYEAVQLLTKITKENPGDKNYTHIVGNLSLANISIMQGNYTEAMEYVQQAYQRASAYTYGQHYSWYESCVNKRKEVERLLAEER
ncbi:MAG: hypothetical protein RBU29_08005 [bacterium]|nr:hypothetical protein [bacterium]